MEKYFFAFFILYEETEDDFFQKKLAKTLNSILFSLLVLNEDLQQQSGSFNFQNNDIVVILNSILDECKKLLDYFGNINTTSNLKK